MPHWAVEQIRVLIAPNSQIVMFITVAIDFLVQPKGQSGPPIRVASKKPKIRSRACSISSRLAVGLFNESMPITERPRRQAPPTASIRSSSLGGAPSGVVLHLNIPAVKSRGRRIIEGADAPFPCPSGRALLDVDADEPNSPRH